MVSGKPLDEYVREEIYLPMGMLDTTFNPEYVIPGASMRIPPTEIDKVYNRGLVHMKVHDERAFFLGGRSEEHTSELQSRGHLVCRLLLEKKKNTVVILKKTLIHTFT